MALQEIIDDIHVLQEDLKVCEYKYGMLSETFYESYTRGEEPGDDVWMLDWADWARAYKTLLRRQKQYRRAIQSQEKETLPLSSLIGKTSRHEPIPATP